MGENYAWATKEENLRLLVQHLLEEVKHQPLTQDRLSEILQKHGKWSPLHAALGKHVKRCFDHFDSDHDGKLDTNEVQALLDAVTASLELNLFGEQDLLCCLFVC